MVAVAVSEGVAQQYDALAVAFLQQVRAVIAVDPNAPDVTADQQLFATANIAIQAVVFSYLNLEDSAGLEDEEQVVRAAKLLSRAIAAVADSLNDPARFVALVAERALGALGALGDIAKADGLGSGPVN